MEYKPFEHKFRITSYDVDCDMNLAVNTLFCYLQETALTQVNLLDIGWDYLGQFNLFWALSKMYIKIERMPKWDEEIIVRTWARRHDVFTQPREFEIIDGSGLTIIRATSTWIILDGATGRFQRLDRFEERLPYWEERVAIEGAAPKIRKTDLPAEPMVYSKVLHSDLDRNHHVNNTKYLQWLFDSSDFEHKDISRLADLTVNYVSQARLGDEYTIDTQETEPGVFNSAIVAKEGHREICRIETKFRG